MSDKDKASSLVELSEHELVFRLGLRLHDLLKHVEPMERSLEVSAYEPFMTLSDYALADLTKLRALVSELLSRQAAARNVDPPVSG